MKHLFPLIIAFVFLNACKELDDLIKFNMDYNTTVVIPSNTGLNLPITLFSPDVETNSEAEFELNNTRKNLVDKVTLTESKMTITSPSGQNFDFLKSIRVFISADGVPEEEVAFLEDIPNNVGNEIMLNPTNINLKDYIIQDSFKLRVNTVTDKVITNDIEINVYSNYLVDAKVFSK